MALLEIILNTLLFKEKEYMTKKISIMLSMLFFLNLLTACVYKNENIRSSPIENNIRYGVYNLPSDFSYNKNDIYDNKDIFNGLFEGLVELDKEGKVVPSLCESYDITDNGIEYRFKLRESLYWSDGSEITSEDFMELFKELLNPSSPKEFASELKSIYGASKYKKGEGTFNDVAIKAVDPHVLVIRLNNKDNNFIKALCKSEYYLRKDFNNLRNLKENYKSILYSGAFKVENYDGDTLYLKRNSKYRSLENASKNDIIMEKKSSSESALADFNLSKCHIFKNPPLSQLQQLESSGYINKSFNGTTIGLYFNNKDNKLDLNFRKALEAAFYAAIIKEDTKSLQWTQYSYGYTFYNKNTNDDNIRVSSNGIKDENKLKERFTSESERAESLLNNSSFKDTKYLNVVVENNEKNKAIAAFVSQALKEILSIKCNVAYVEKDQINNSIKENNFSVFITGMTTKSNEDFVYTWYSKSDKNIFKFLDIKYDTLINKYALEKNEIIKKGYLVEAQKHIEDNKIFMPLFFDFDVLCKGENVENIIFDGEGNIILKEMFKGDSTPNKSIEEIEIHDKDIVPIG